MFEEKWRSKMIDEGANFNSIAGEYEIGKTNASGIEKNENKKKITSGMQKVGRLSALWKLWSKLLLVAIVYCKIGLWEISILAYLNICLAYCQWRDFPLSYAVIPLAIATSNFFHNFYCLDPTSFKFFNIRTMETTVSETVTTPHKEYWHDILHTKAVVRLRSIDIRINCDYL